MNPPSIPSIALLSCVKTKRKSRSAAKDLYTSALFAGMRRYAEVNADAWYILSAKYHVLRPDKVVNPYEQTLHGMRLQDRVAWAKRVQSQLLELLPPSAEVVLLAGARYREHRIGASLSPFLWKD